MRPARTGFWIGFSLAVGALLAVAVVAAARSGGSTQGRSAPAFAARGSHHVAQSTRPLVERLAVFTRARRDADVLPAAAADAFDSLRDQGQVGPELRPGMPDLSRSRLLLPNVGSWHGAFYATPTGDGNVCYVVTGGPASCATGFTQAFPVGAAIFDRDGVGFGTPTAITGLVPNDVATVTVLAGGGHYTARLANNAYFLELPNNAVGSPDSLLIGYRDGSTLTMPLPTLRRSGSE